MRSIFFSIFLVFHALAHLVGTAVYWQVRSFRSMPYSPTVLNGAIHIGDVGARLFGYLWILGALGFFIVSFGVWTNASWSRKFMLVTTIFSLVLCIFYYDAAKVGIVINSIILFSMLVAELRRGSSFSNRAETQSGI
jgi:hypothetical protein